jgi:hypothetical protein
MEASTAVKTYNLEVPTEKDLLVSLDRLVGAVETRRLWTNARSQAGVPLSGKISMDQFERTLQELKKEKGVAMISANSMLIRLKSYRTLSILHK